MSEANITDMIAKYGFSIAVAVWLLYERQKVFIASEERWKQLYDAAIKQSELVMEVVKQNTAGYTKMEATIQKLCEMMNGGKHDGSD